jgi:hypothetical protein
VYFFVLFSFSAAVGFESEDQLGFAKDMGGNGRCFENNATTLLPHDKFL